MNEPLDVLQAPPEFEQLLKDPRLDDLKDAPDWLPRAQRVLEPANPPVAGESPFLLFREWSEDKFGTVEWLNEPPGIAFILQTGSGQGFKLITEPPRFNERKKKPAKRPDAWTYSSWLIASAAFAEIVRRFDPEAIETLPIDWEFSDGRKLDGYVFLDVRRLVHAYDYHRSAVRVEIKNGKKYVAGLEHPRALKPGIDSAFHVFRDAFKRDDIFMSPQLARALTAAGIRGIRFEDPVSIDTVRF